MGQEFGKGLTGKIWPRCLAALRLAGAGRADAKAAGSWPGFSASSLRISPRQLIWASSQHGNLKQLKASKVLQEILVKDVSPFMTQPQESHSATFGILVRQPRIKRRKHKSHFSVRGVWRSNYTKSMRNGRYCNHLWKIRSSKHSQEENPSRRSVTAVQSTSSRR